MDPSTDYTLLSTIAGHLGASEQALRLLVSLLLGYPIIYVHKLFLKDRAPTLQHLYFIFSGLFLAIFNYGFNCYHSVVCVVANWIILKLIGGTVASVVASFLLQMGYLLTGYYFTGTENYDIKWTMPHCVLALRLIALTFDVYDGTKQDGQLSKDQIATALKTSPSLLETASQTYFPASFMVGPQFSMKRYLNFVKGKLYPPKTASPVGTGLLRGFTGLVFLAIFQIGSIWFPSDYFLSESYHNLCYLSKLLAVGLWGKVLLYKYISCWLITEGICIMCGLAYSGTDADGKALWKGCANVKLTRFETGRTFGHLISSFNMNTNAWVMQYVYKRLRFLNNRYFSQLGALLFLALWHGFHSGYYACFFMEFIILAFEKDLLGLIKKYPALSDFFDRPTVSALLFVLLRIYTIGFMGYCLGPFVLLKAKWWWGFYTSTYFIGHVFFLSYWLYRPLLKKVFKACNTALSDNPSIETSKKLE